MIFSPDTWPEPRKLAGQATKGYNGCVVCLDNTEARWLNHSKKMVYLGHRRFLPLNHPYRKNKNYLMGHEKNVELQFIAMKGKYLK